jgi:hypothetical protein
MHPSPKCVSSTASNRPHSKQYDKRQDTWEMKKLHKIGYRLKQDRILCTGTYSVRREKQTTTLVLFSGEARCLKWPLRIIGHSSVTCHYTIFWLICVLQMQLEVTVSFLSKTTNSYPCTHSDTIISTPVLPRQNLRLYSVWQRKSSHSKQVCSLLTKWVWWHSNKLGNETHSIAIYAPVKVR